MGKVSEVYGLDMTANVPGHAQSGRGSILGGLRLTKQARGTIDL